MAAQPDQTHTFAEGEFLLFSISNSSWNCQLGKFSPVPTLAPSPSKENPFFLAQVSVELKRCSYLSVRNIFPFMKTFLSAGLTVSSLD